MPPPASRQRTRTPLPFTGLGFRPFASQPMSLFLPLGTVKKEHGLKFALRYLKDPHFREAPRLCKSFLIVHRPYSVASSYRHSAMSGRNCKL